MPCATRSPLPFPDVRVQVTQFFAPNNGGDQVFPRKERVRVWKPAEKTIVGIGGGQLKFKGWNRGTSDRTLRNASLQVAIASALAELTPRSRTTL